MPVTPPNSGDVITQAAMHALFDSVKDEINTIETSQIARAGLGPQHFVKSTGGIVLVSDQATSTTNTAVTATAASDLDADITANWQELSNYTLDNSSSGYSLTNGYIIGHYNFRVKDWDSTPDDDHMIWIAVSYRKDAGSETVMRDTVYGVFASDFS